jgi:hypothetical protein
MQSAGEDLGPKLAASVDRRAREVSDPVDRLRYLRHTMGNRWRFPGWRFVFLRSKRADVTAILAITTLALLAGPVMRRFRRPGPAVLTAAKLAPAAAPKVWPVDASGETELYSNGLRIDRRYEVSYRKRGYNALPRGREETGVPEWRTAPAGIVFHTTESYQAPFDEKSVKRLTRIGDSLMRYVAERHAYHYVVDRFGRVFRVVREQDAANHAGHSIWADRDWTYLELNDAFLAVAVETETQPGSDQPSANAAQIHSVRVLTEMLRAKYSLGAQNCVTHAQVSVNQGAHQIGWHVDWAANFPFAEVGLPDNYQTALPSLTLFGFQYDSALVRFTGAAFWRGLLLAEEDMKQEAAREGMSLRVYRQGLEGKYQRACRRIQAQDDSQEGN